MEQNHSYVFISYAHKDAHFVLPCVEAMKKCGIDLWYDDGIEAGSEWPEFIAQKVVNCSKFVLFVSDAYLASQNCKRELNFAISRKKDILSLYIGNVALSPGMEMQLGTYQAIYRNRFSTDAQFHNSLCSEHFFDSCRLVQTGAAQPQPAPQATTGGSAYQQSATASAQQSSVFMKAASVAESTWNSAKQGMNTAKQSVSSATQNVSSQFNNFFSGKQSASAAAATAENAVPAKKKRLVALLLACFLGWLGIHKFYLRQPVFGIAYLVLFFTWIPLVLSLVEALLLILCRPETLTKFYKCDLEW